MSGRIAIDFALDQNDVKKTGSGQFTEMSCIDRFPDPGKT
jgi:hypothetical protein